METNRTETNWTEVERATTAECRAEVRRNGAGAAVARAEVARREAAEERMETANRAAQAARVQA